MVTAYLSSTTETTEETLTLTETGAHTGIFRGTIVADTAGAPAADGLIQVQNMGQLFARYRDESDEWVSPAVAMTISRNTITAPGYGIQLSEITVTEPAAFALDTNTVRGTAAALSRGILVQNVTDTVLIRGNTVKRFQHCVYFAGTVAPSYRYNNTDSATYVFYNNSSRAVDGRYNFWGRPATDSIAAGGNPKNIAQIYDNFDNGARGMVNYTCWLDAENGTPAPSYTSATIDLVNGSGSPVTYYRLQDTVFVRVTDPDQDLTAGADTVTVTASSTREPGGEPVKLAETGEFTGVFTGWIRSDTAGSAAADGLLQARSGEKVYVHYHDATDSWGQEADRRDSVLYGNIWSGTISANTTWYKTASPYYIMGTLSVAATCTLTVTVTVIPANRPPDITSTPVTAATEDAPYSYDVNATDPDPRDVLIVSLVQAPPGIITIVDNTMTWQTTVENTGEYLIVVQVTDEKDAWDRDTLVMTVEAPVRIREEVKPSAPVNPFTGFAAAPNLARPGEPVWFRIGGLAEPATLELTVFDGVGNIMFGQNFRYDGDRLAADGFLFGPWDLRSRSGGYVTQGTYLAVVKVRTDSGRGGTARTKIGVKSGR